LLERPEHTEKQGGAETSAAGSDSFSRPPADTGLSSAASSSIEQLEEVDTDTEGGPSSSAGEMSHDWSSYYPPELPTGQETEGVAAAEGAAATEAAMDGAAAAAAEGETCCSVCLAEFEAEDMARRDRTERILEIMPRSSWRSSSLQLNSAR
jgi:hypothetical protein